MAKILDLLFKTTYNNNTVLSATVELTQKCNLNCVHCYLSGRKPKHELTTDELKQVMNQLARSGCLYLVFTGGEVFLRKDIITLCEYAKSKHFDLRLFSNGTLIDEQTIRALSKIGLSSIELSLYGNRSVHDKITRRKGSFHETINAISLLSKHKIPVTIKSPLMKFNYRDYGWIINFAARFGLSYKFDPVITPANNGDKKVLQYRLSDKQLMSLFKDKRIFKKQRVLSRPNDKSDSMFCSAGRNFVSISCDGTVYPCLQLQTPLGIIPKKRLHFTNNLSKIWANVSMRSIKQTDLVKCNNCKNMVFCRRCPGLAFLEDGDLCGPSTVACKLAEVYCKI
jgi:radical SAM protein with 4Fe4S-binding SPASM domain